MDNPRQKLLWLLVLVPTLTELLETGHFPSSVRDITTDVAMTLVVILLILVSQVQLQKIGNLETETREMLREDGLTGLPQWASFQRNVRHFLAIRDRSEFRIVFLSIQSKPIADNSQTVGIADTLIVEIAKRISLVCDEHKWTVYRTGLLDFAFVTDGEGREEEERLISDLETLRASLNALLDPHGVVVISSSKSRPSDSFDRLIARVAFSDLSSDDGS